MKGVIFLMKREMDMTSAPLFYQNWAGQFESFSHMEFACAIPQVLFLISTVKDNGKPNLCFHSWSCFGGDAGGYFAVMQNVPHLSHTYRNIVREGEFCINFVSAQYYPNCIATIQSNAPADDEFEAGHFTPEPARTVKAPRVRESFLSLECELACNVDLSRQGLHSMIIGRVRNAAADEAYIEGLDKRFGKEGFMFNIHEPADYATGQLLDTHAATLDVLGSYADLKDKPFGGGLS